MAEFNDCITDKTDIRNSGMYYIGIKTFFFSVSQVKNECHVMLTLCHN